MDRFVLTDAQWAKMEPRCLGKPGDPGRSGKDNRLFVEAVLWIARTGSPWRDLPPAFGNWNSVFTRFRDWVKGTSGDGCSTPSRTSPTWNTRWSTPPSSRSTVTGKVQKGDFASGYWPIQRRLDHQDPGAHRRARQPRALCTSAGAALRHGWHAAAHRRSLIRGADRGHGVRQQ